MNHLLKSPKNIILENEIDHLHHIFTTEDMMPMKHNEKLPMITNIPSSTLGYFKGEWVLFLYTTKEHLICHFTEYNM